LYGRRLLCLTERVREGASYLFTAFPIGTVLGLHPVTHRTMIAALTPIVIPAARGDKLDPRAVRRIMSGSFTVFQLDGTACPRNSGSFVYHPASGEVVGIVNSVFIKGTIDDRRPAASREPMARPAPEQKMKGPAKQAPAY
jgi:serine protease Do